MKIKRIMIAAPKSGSGKTGVTCALLKNLKNKGIKTVSFKCGPDYIDPLFHKNVLGIPSYNLDTFFTDPDTTRALFARNARGFDYAVFEGVMGLFDGVGGVREEGSSYHLAKVTGTPVVLVIDAKGMGRSIVPEILGFLAYDTAKLIKGVILNRVSESFYKVLKDVIESECDVKVCGFIPDMKDKAFSSRHLGLVTPSDTEGLDEILDGLADNFAKFVSFDDIDSIALEAEDLKELSDEAYKEGLSGIIHSEGNLNSGGEQNEVFSDDSPVIAVSQDDAFCFIYEDNLNELKKAGAKIVFFSPLKDKAVPGEADGLLLTGGYPELHLEELCANASMLESVKKAFDKGMPVVAECGGFMYLNETVEDRDGRVYKTVGALKGRVAYKGKSVRFGYVELSEKTPNFLGKDEIIKGHEFHYFDCDDNGRDVIVRKPSSQKEYEAVKDSDNIWVGFPHLYYPSNPAFAVDFVRKCTEYKMKKTGKCL